MVKHIVYYIPLVFMFLFMFINKTNNAQIQAVFEPSSQYHQQYRQLIKGQNHKTIQQFNKDPSKGFSLRPNKFLHLKNDQFLATFGRGHISQPNVLNQMKGSSNEIINVNISQNRNLTGDVYVSDQNYSINVDLTQYATPVKDQGACNSCYAHSTTATIQLMLNMNSKLVIDLSQQQMLDCSSVWAPPQYKSFNNQGCGGGWGWKVYHYVKYNGITTQANYPYVSGNTGKAQSCDKKAKYNQTFKISSYSQYYDGVSPESQCNILDNTLKQGRPIAVSIYAPQGPQYQFYGSHESQGIQIFDFCGNYTIVTHQVMLLGVNQSSLIKNAFSFRFSFFFIKQSIRLNQALFKKINIFKSQFKSHSIIIQF